MIVNSKCENCNKEHDGGYGSGRFCSAKCARGFSTKNKRKEINKKVSEKLSYNNKKYCECGKTLDYRNTSGYCLNCKPGSLVKHCVDCGKEKSNSKSVRCVECSRKYKENEYIKKWLKNGQTETNRQPQNYIRRHLLNEQNNLCSICGVKPEWNGKPIVFILDHIDGDCHNNNRKNLRMICPMCDSQLPTFKSKNKNSSRRREKYNKMYG
jgi:hypothetical protein